MPYDNNALVPLLVNSGFTLWLYRTTDTRAEALGADYFAPAAARLSSGDAMLLQAADALTLTTVRIGTEVATGLVVDTFAVPFRVNRSAAQFFSVRTLASAVAMTVLLAPLAGGFVAGSSILAAASVVGPVAEVAFSISDADGATVRGPQTATVSGGTASTTLASPAAGAGYRLRVEAVGHPLLVDTSVAFSVGEAFALLDQGGFALLAEDGGRLLV
ncbi:MAG TPA: hypothetical protein VGN83_10845 [Falsiroseomonas sp.]|jgi:hypothetical protein|nr:hypothetical protein [Falsiroseomonas sp.]